MSIVPIKAFSEKAKADAALKESLKACQKIKELRALAQEHGFAIEENSLYPPNEPQFTEEQLSEHLVKARCGFETQAPRSNAWAGSPRPLSFLPVFEGRPQQSNQSAHPVIKLVVASSAESDSLTPRMYPGCIANQNMRGLP
ncbi:MAG TPA: Nif11-like leader peptide family natural product precursor [Azonexus sp.]|nr:Nif11-like leader peptide family natural product precursor [Azonexus sp.]